MSLRKEFLQASAVIDADQSDVRAMAARLARGHRGPAGVARACFEWVRDEIAHTADHALDPVTCSASEVLQYGTGFCYAKSHLLAALLRANHIPAGLSYQRLVYDNEGGKFCLHSLNALWLPELGWYRVDARGSRNDLHAEFDPPREVLPYRPAAPGEIDFFGVWAEPVEVVLAALQRHRTRAALEAALPDAQELDGHGDCATTDACGMSPQS
jgi:transglutaminase-like putative cysteine protease